MPRSGLTRLGRLRLRGLGDRLNADFAGQTAAHTPTNTGNIHRQRSMQVVQPVSSTAWIRVQLAATINARPSTWPIAIARIPSVCLDEVKRSSPVSMS